MSSQTDCQSSVTEDPEVSLFRAARGYYETKALLAMWRTGLLQQVAAGEALKPAELSRAGYDEELLTGLFDYLVVRDFLRRDEDGYRLSERGAGLAPYFGYLGTMIGAYEPVMSALEDLLTGEKAYGRDVHRWVPDLANGLTALEDSMMQQFPSLLGGRTVSKVMDLGCGAGRMLCRLVASRPDVVGVGVDANDEICQVARGTVSGEGLDGQISIVVGDAGQVSQLPAEAREGVDVVTIMFVLHELLRQRGPEGVLTCLRDIADTLRDNGGALLAVEVESAGEPRPRDDLFFIPEYEFSHVLTHQRLATKAEWSKLADAAGLQVERIEPLRMCRSFCMVLTPKD